MGKEPGAAVVGNGVRGSSREPDTTGRTLRDTSAEAGRGKRREARETERTSGGGCRKKMLCSEDGECWSRGSSGTCSGGNVLNAWEAVGRRCPGGAGAGAGR